LGAARSHNLAASHRELEGYPRNARVKRGKDNGVHARRAWRWVCIGGQLRRWPVL